MRLLPLLFLLAVPAQAQPPEVSPAAALLRAARSGDTAGLRAALGAGAPVEARDASGASALMLAAHGGHPAALNALLDAGADRARPAAYRLDSTAFYGSLLAAAAGEGHGARPRPPRHALPSAPRCP